MSRRKSLPALGKQPPSPCVRAGCEWVWDGQEADVWRKHQEMHIQRQPDRPYRDFRRPGDQQGYQASLLEQEQEG